MKLTKKQATPSYGKHLLPKKIGKTVLSVLLLKGSRAFFCNHHIISIMKYKLIILCSFLAIALHAQTPNDTTIYEIAETMPYPLIKNCQIELHPNWTVDSVKRCAENSLLSILSKNMIYPADARDNNIQGTVVTSFVVEKDGRMTNFKSLKDIGGGCGTEAIRVLQAFEEVGLRWQPATKGGQAVRTKQSIPLRFRLQEALPYYISPEGDSIYTQIDTDIEYKLGTDSLLSFLINRIQYPKSEMRSCKTGLVEMAVQVQKDGSVKVDNQIDFNNIGLDFQFEALRLINQTKGQWTAATYKGQPVSTILPLRVLFKSDAPECATANSNFDRAMILSDEGAKLLDEKKTEEAIKKWDEALVLHPNNSELLYYRGTAYLNLNKKEETCKDWNQVKTILGITWFESMRKVICGW